MLPPKESKEELYFGCKFNVIADANYGLPLLGRPRPANAHDATVMTRPGGLLGSVPLAGHQRGQGSCKVIGLFGFRSS